MVKNVGVIGHGLMGKGIAQVFALKGYNVFLFGRRDCFNEEYRKYLENEQKKGRIKKSELSYILKNISFHNMNNDIEILSRIDLVIETIIEDKESKLDLLRRIKDFLKEDAIVASNTSTISITKLAVEVKKPENFIGMHFFSPVPLMDVVEVVRGLRTGVETVAYAESIARHIGKEPFIVDDTPGFVFNRMLVPMVNEAASIYFENYEGSPQIVDNILKKGLNLRFGPLELADLTGVDVMYYSMKSIYETTMDPKYKPCLKMKRMVDAGYIGRKAGRGFYNYEGSEMKSKNETEVG